jgi:hypothetical protein
MFESPMSVSRAAFGSLFRDLSVGGVRAVNPVVARNRQEPEHDQRPRAASARYTPQSALGNEVPLYSRSGVPTTSSGVFVSSSIDRSESLEFEVRTADGDVATLSFTHSSAQATRAGASQTNGGISMDIVSETSSSTDFEVSVQGDLSKEELLAINALAKQVGEVADDVFDGNMEEAMQVASRININSDSDTLSSYAFSVQSQEMQTVAAVYEEVARSTAPMELSRDFGTSDKAVSDDPMDGNGRSRDLLTDLWSLMERFKDQLRNPQQIESQ